VYRSGAEARAKGRGLPENAVAAQKAFEGIDKRDKITEIKDKIEITVKGGPDADKALTDALTTFKTEAGAKAKGLTEAEAIEGIIRSLKKDPKFDKTKEDALRAALAKRKDGGAAPLVS
jgi:hypothetical protein